MYKDGEVFPGVLYTFVYCFLLLTSAVMEASGQFMVQAELGYESVLHAGTQFVGADLKSVSCLN